MISSSRAVCPLSAGAPPRWCMMKSKFSKSLPLCARLLHSNQQAGSNGNWKLLASPPPDSLRPSMTSLCWLEVWHRYESRWPFGPACRPSHTIRMPNVQSMAADPKPRALRGEAGKKTRPIKRGRHDDMRISTPALYLGTERAREIWVGYFTNIDTVKITRKTRHHRSIQLPAAAVNGSNGSEWSGNRYRW